MHVVHRTLQSLIRIRSLPWSIYCTVLYEIDESGVSYLFSSLKTIFRHLNWGFRPTVQKSLPLLEEKKNVLSSLLELFPFQKYEMEHGSMLNTIYRYTSRKQWKSRFFFFFVKYSLQLSFYVLNFRTGQLRVYVTPEFAGLIIALFIFPTTPPLICTLFFQKNLLSLFLGFSNST